MQYTNGCLGVFCGLSLGLSACVGNTASEGVAATDASPKSPTDSNTTSSVLFATWTPGTYGTKVKTLLAGTGLDANEYAALQADPNALPGLIDTWMETPAWHAIMDAYFRKVFQQSDNPATDQLGAQFVTAEWDWYAFHQRYNIQASMDDMWPRTVLAMVDAGQPFTQTMTTQTYMMNTASMALLGYFDAAPNDDYGNVQDSNHGNWLMATYPSLTMTRQASTSIASAESMNPNNSNFLNFYDAVPTDVGLSKLWCAEPLTFNWTNCVQGGGAAANTCFFQAYEVYGNVARNTLRHLFGARFFCDPYPMSVSDPRWPAGATNATRGGLLLPSDWSDWRLVTIRKPHAGETPTLFMNLPALRQSQELVLSADYSGFMTTPAFLYKWPTNTSNQHRVTTNQALIVGLDYTFAPSVSSTTTPATADPNLHAAPGTSCYSCHSTLDPMRDLVWESYNLSPSRQTYTLSTPINRTGVFSVPGAASVSGTGIAAFGMAIASHPRFAAAWTQKLCRFANSVPCDETDPEFQRIVAAFVESDYNFKTLMRELFSSPLVTYAQATLSATEAGTTVGILRRDAFCGAMSARLHWTDACQLRGFGIYGDNTAEIDPYFLGLRSLANTLPDTTFSRGIVAPAMPLTANLFYVNASDELCRQWSSQLVDPNTLRTPLQYGATLPTGSVWSSSDPNTAIADFVANVMGMSDADPRSATVKVMLAQHQASALALGASPVEALRSTFVVACRSTISLSQGM